MKKIGFKALFRASASMAIALVLLPACKPGRSESSGQSLKNSSAPEVRGSKGSKEPKEFKIRFVVSNELQPDFSRLGAKTAKDELTEGLMREGNVIQLKKRIPIPKSPQHLFLILPEKFSGHQIVDASYEHQTIAPSNSVASDSGRDLVSYDSDAHRFYLRIEELSRAKKGGMSPLDLQILTLRLRMEDGSQADLELRFYIKAELPRVEDLRIDSEKTPFVHGSVDELRLRKAAGFVFLREKYQNPTDRPLLFWFGIGKSKFELQTELAMKVDYSSWHFLTPPVEEGLEPDQREVSRSRLYAIQLVVSKDGNSDASKDGSTDGQQDRKSVLSLTKSQASIRLEPGETMEIEWVGREPSSSKSSRDAKNSDNSKIIGPVDGAPASRQFWACFRANETPALLRAWQSGCAHFVYENPDYETHPVELPAVWAISGYHAVPTLQDAVWVTEDGIDLQDAIAGEMALAIPAKR